MHIARIEYRRFGCLNLKHGAWLVRMMVVRSRLPGVLPLGMTMKAVYINHYGGTEVMHHGDRPMPEPEADEVRIRVFAASVNPRDWMVRSGRYQFRHLLPPFPVILGSDVSGVVDVVGRKVKKFKAGDAVFGMQHPLRGMMGAYAEYVCMPEKVLAPKPENLNHVQAAALPLGALTAWCALFKSVRMRAGWRILIIGGTGSVGSSAIQIAKAFGAEVIAVCGRRNIELVSDLGADRVIDYTNQKFTDEVTDCDLVFDTIGMENPKSCAAVLKPKAAYITTVPNLRTMFRALVSRLLPRWLGSSCATHVVLVRANGSFLKKIGQLAQQGKLKPVIDTVYSLDRAAEAHAYSRTFHTRGKLVFRLHDHE